MQWGYGCPLQTDWSVWGTWAITVRVLVCTGIGLSDRKGISFRSGVSTHPFGLSAKVSLSTPATLGWWPPCKPPPPCWKGGGWWGELLYIHTKPTASAASTPTGTKPVHVLQWMRSSALWSIGSTTRVDSARVRLCWRVAVVWSGVLGWRLLTRG